MGYDGFLYSGGEGVEDADRRCKVSTTEQNLGLLHDDLNPAYDASVDVTGARNAFQATSRVGEGSQQLVDRENSDRASPAIARYPDADNGNDVRVR